MPHTEKNLTDLFHDTLRDIYYTEKKMMMALPKMSRAAKSAKLRRAFEDHLLETAGQKDRLEQVFELIDKPARAKKCPAIDGIVEEGTEIMKDYKDSPALDAGLLAAAQAAEHYEISRYGTLKAWSEKLGLEKVTDLLDQSLREEKKTDAALIELAEASINEKADALA